MYSSDNLYINYQHHKYTIQNIDRYMHIVDVTAG